MSVVRVKICGITTIREAQVSVEEGVDALGFVFAESPRRVSSRKAASIIERIPPFISCTGVFVNETIKYVTEIADYCSLDTLQFHGDETPEYCRCFSGYRIIKSFPAGPGLTAEKVKGYSVNALLIDTKYTDRRGGGGQVFDWQLALPFTGGTPPLILAGGLHAGNLSDALQTVKPFAVDVSSGVEIDGRKDSKKIREFMRIARRL